MSDDFTVPSQLGLAGITSTEAGTEAESVTVSSKRGAIAGEYGRLVTHVIEHGSMPELELAARLGVKDPKRVTKYLLKAVLAKAIPADEPTYDVIRAKGLPKVVKDRLKCLDNDLVRIDSDEKEDGINAVRITVIKL